MIEIINTDKPIEELFKEKLTNLASYFRQQDFYYKNIFDFTCIEGKMYKSQSFTTEERKSTVKRINSLNGMFAPNQCFSNSGKLAMSDSKNKIKYVEGFIFKREIGIPILHAWNEINGKIIDITLINKFGEYSLGEYENDMAYFGTVFPIGYVRSIFLQKTKSRSLLSDISDHNNPWPILKERFTDDYINSL